ncbi:Alpha/Beta hydrolase protein [Phellopilus nigrolimitatus]|nr:Alpha/Beta hydrolase protein [Phellopilus nigrolimitatus]
MLWLHESSFLDYVFLSHAVSLSSGTGRRLWLIGCLSLLVSSRQIPKVDGVHGGVPASASSVNKDAALPKPQVSGSPVAGKLRFIETFGVLASGYADLTTSQSMWWWFFASRNNSCDLVQWRHEATVSLNKYSWNNNANIFQSALATPTATSRSRERSRQRKQCGTCFISFFANDTVSAYAKNDVSLWTESYGGHCGPAFAHYFLEQNAAIAAGTLTGTAINLKTLGVGNGLTDPLSQYAEYMVYAGSNPYLPTVSSSVIEQANTSFFLRVGRLQIPDPIVLRYQVDVGLVFHGFWQETNNDVFNNFAKTGDWVLNSAPDLEAVINAGIRTVIYDGDADYMLNFKGVEAMVDNFQTQFNSLYQQQSFSNYTVAGQPAGLIKNAGSFSYIRMFGSGHEVPVYNNMGLETGQHDEYQEAFVGFNVISSSLPELNASKLNFKINFKFCKIGKLDGPAATGRSLGSELRDLRITKGISAGHSFRHSITNLLKRVNQRKSRTVFEDSIQKLRHFFPDNLLLAALDLIDRERGQYQFSVFQTDIENHESNSNYVSGINTVMHLKTQWGHSFYEVHGSTSAYTVQPDLLPHKPAYCSCPSFAFSVILSEDQLMCKHLLAVQLAQRLSKCAERNITDGDIPSTQLVLND